MKMYHQKNSNIIHFMNRIILFISLSIVYTSCSRPGYDRTGVARNEPASKNRGASTLEGVSEKADTVLAIGSRLELFVDDFLIGKLAGDAALRIHHPVPKEIALVHDAPWEGPGSGYHSVFKDGDIYRMYYKMWQRTAGPGDPNTDNNPLLTGYAESKDGISWYKPDLGLFEFNGSKKNNIVFAGGPMGPISPDAGHPSVFKDENPDAAPDARYKALMPERFGSGNPRGLIALKSPDGIHWTPIVNRPLITAGAFDSQNIAFWDPDHQLYRAYWRANNKVPASAENLSGVRRDVRTATSKDFINWSNWVELKYTDGPLENLYVSQIKPYYRAPHIFVGFPARYFDRDWSASMDALPDSTHRKWRGRSNRRLGTALTDAMLMGSHDGLTFKLWRESFLRPGIERTGTWSYGQQFIGWHVVETRSDLEGAPNELSFYASEKYWSGARESALRRYTLRLDGFVSVNAPAKGGELTTKPLTFTGSRLLLNFSSSVAGDIRVEIQDENGTPVPGFTLADCSEIFGDAISRPAHWKNSGHNVSSLAGKTVRLRFVLKDADLYSIQFK